MECQVGNLPDAGRELGRLDRAGRSLRKLVGFVVRGTGKVVRDPGILVRRVRALAGRVPTPRECNAVVQEASPASRLPSLGLKEGEQVRVKSWEEIRTLLDEGWRTGGLAWMPEMRAFCGGEYKVIRQVDRFFDEKSRRLLKVRGIVLLEGVHCRPENGAPTDYAGCQRMCFLFWKEAWLERAASDHRPDKRRI